MRERRPGPPQLPVQRGTNITDAGTVAGTLQPAAQQAPSMTDAGTAAGTLRLAAQRISVSNELPLQLVAYGLDHSERHFSSFGMLNYNEGV